MSFIDEKQIQINTILAPVVLALGYEFVGCEYITQGSEATLRVFIDKEGGVTLEDCSKVSRQLSAVLDVEEPIGGKYTFEVSSPGINRPLFTPAHFARFKGCKVKVRLIVPIDGRRNFTGNIVDVQDEFIVLDVEGEQFKLKFVTINKANLVEF
jgi:ribosome maturation factor RimP